MKIQFYTALLHNEPTTGLAWRILVVCIAIILINLPFGYWRGGLRKLSFWWFVAIHAPVPLVILIRKFQNIELSWELAPFLFGSYFIGQILGRLCFKSKFCSLTHKTNQPPLI